MEPVIIIMRLAHLIQVGTVLGMCYQRNKAGNISAKFREQEQQMFSAPHVELKTI